MENDLPSNLRPTSLDSDVIRRALEEVNRQESANSNQNSNGNQSTNSSPSERRIDYSDKKNTFDPNDTTQAKTSTEKPSGNSSGNSDGNKLMKGFIIFIVLIVVTAIIIYVVNRHRKAHSERKERLKSDIAPGVIDQMQASDFIRNVKIFGELAFYFLGLYALVFSINKVVKTSTETVG